MKLTAPLDLGSWLGRRQAFGLIANKCSAADAECLQHIRETGAYTQLDLTWEEFCRLHLHISRSYADRLIQQLTEFGETYFKLSQVIGISTATYRQIQPCISHGRFEYEGEMIDICLENAEKIYNAVDGLRRQAADARAQLTRTKTALRLTPAGVRVRLDRNRHKFDCWMTELVNVATSGLPAESAEQVQAALGYAANKLAALIAELPPQYRPDPGMLIAPPTPPDSAHETARHSKTRH